MILKKLEVRCVNMKQKFGAAIWHFATYVDRYNTEGYGEPRSVLDAIN